VRRKRVSGTLLAAAALGLFACVHGAREPRIVPSGGSTVLVYLDPRPGPPEILEVSLEALGAVGADGQEVPLPLRQSVARTGRLPGGRLLAWGILPPGPYTGLSLRVRAITVQTADGQREISPPGGELRTPVSFEAVPGRAVVVRLGLGGSVGGGEETASGLLLTARLPGRLATGLAGIVSCRRADLLVVFDKMSGEVAGAIATGHKPAGVALDLPRGRAYVALSDEDAVEAVDLVELAVLSRVPLAAGDEPVDVALSPDGRTLLVANRGSGTVSALDPDSLFERGRSRVGDGPEFLVVDGQGRRAYVANALSSSVSVLELPAGSPIGTIPTEPAPFRAALSRDGTRLYVVHRTSPYLSVLDVGAGRVERRVYVGLGASALAVDRATDRIYLALRGSNSVAIYDPLSLLPTDSVAAGGDVGFLAIDPEGNSLCMTLPSDGQVRLARLVGKQEFAQAEVPEDPYEVALPGER